MLVNRNKKTPLYKQIYEVIRKKIAQNEYKSGELLPSERELGEMFNVDRITIRSALEILVKDGLVEKQAGVGTKVKDLPLNHRNKGNSKNIVFVLPKPGNSVDRIIEPFNANLFHRIEQEISPKGFSLVYATIDKKENDLIDILPGDVSGIMFVSNIYNKFYEQARKLQIPFILVNNYDKKYTSIMINNENGAYEAVSYLINNGHKKIGVIRGLVDYITSIERYEGYKKALVDANIDLDKQIVMDGDWSFSGGYEAMRRLIINNEGELPTAIFAFNDNTAFGAIKAIQEKSLNVPEDISVIGFDNIEQCEYFQPPLSTIAADVDLIGKTSCQHLLNIIETGESFNIRIEVPTELVIRESVKNFNK